MTPAAIAAIMTLIGEVVSAAPGVIAEIEALIARVKAPVGAHLAPQVTADTATLAKELGS